MDDFTFTPEPSTLVLCSSLGAMGLVRAWRRRVARLTPAIRTATTANAVQRA
ncbi:MAG: PEP-CTERM sorting domain-containing protein [Thermoguttaceae bacterium]